MARSKEISTRNRSWSSKGNLFSKLAFAMHKGSLSKYSFRIRGMRRKLIVLFTICWIGNLLLQQFLVEVSFIDWLTKKSSSGFLYQHLLESSFAAIIFVGLLFSKNKHAIVRHWTFYLVLAILMIQMVWYVAIMGPKTAPYSPIELFASSNLYVRMIFLEPIKTVLLISFLVKRLNIKKVH